MTDDTEKRTVLLVDDDPDFLAQQKLLLTSAGFDVLDARSVAEAEEMLDGGTFDIAVVDLMMEHVDAGFTLCYHLKKKAPDVPVIMVTGVTAETGHEFDAATSEERSWIKADVALAKPVRFEQLKREIDRLLAEAAGKAQ